MMNDNVSQVKSSRHLREKLLGDKYRPRYHFAIIEDLGYPGDPNGAFFKDGVYHLMYLYNRSGKTYWDNANFSWGHISSMDLVHWRHHPDAITSGDGDGGCFSGGGFVDDDGTAYISYWKLPLKGEKVKGSGIGIAMSTDKYCGKWEKIKVKNLDGTQFGIIDMEDENGSITHLGNADPSNIWKFQDYYYMQMGTLEVLNKYGREKDSEQKYKGDWVELFRSKDMIDWEYVHRFYHRDKTNKWTDETEDDMCPSFLPLARSKKGGDWSGKYLQLFIAHNKGCQYYIGDYDTKKQIFIPEKHGRMSWSDNTYFAPEALIDDKGRQIMWAWLTDNAKHEKDEMLEEGWSGVYGMPRVLWLDENYELAMAPVQEMERLRYNEKCYESFNIT